MNYDNYEKAIVERHRVQLVGWPIAGGAIVNPSTFTSIPDGRQLHEALVSGACKWVKMGAQAVRDFDADMKRRREAGVVIGVERAGKRSDAGGKHAKRRRNNEDDEEEDGGEQSPPRRKRRAAARHVEAEGEGDAGEPQPPKQSRRKSAGTKVPPAAPKSREFIPSDDEDDDDTPDKDDGQVGSGSGGVQAAGGSMTGSDGPANFDFDAATFTFDPSAFDPANFTFDPTLYPDFDFNAPLTTDPELLLRYAPMLDAQFLPQL